MIPLSWQNALTLIVLCSFSASRRRHIVESLRVRLLTFAGFIFQLLAAKMGGRVEVGKMGFVGGLRPLLQNRKCRFAQHLLELLLFSQLLRHRLGGKVEDLRQRVVFKFHTLFLSESLYLF